MVGEQKIGIADDRLEHIVEIMSDAPGELADRLHLLGLRELRFERALLGRLDGVDDRGLALASGGAAGRRHEEARRARLLASKRRVDRRRRDAAFGGGGNRPIDRGAAGIGHDARDGAPFAAFGTKRASEEAKERCIGAQDPARGIDDRERERGGVEQPRETNLGGALRLVLRALGAAIENERARGAGFPIMREGHAVQHAHRDGLAAALLQVDVEDVGHHIARRAGEMGGERGGIARDHIGELEAARADLREIVIEPGSERGVHIRDGARAIDRHEARRRMIEIVDRLLQLLEDVLLALAITRDVGNGP